MPVWSTSVACALSSCTTPPFIAIGRGADLHPWTECERPIFPHAAVGGNVRSRRDTPGIPDVLPLSPSGCPGRGGAAAPRPALQRPGVSLAGAHLCPGPGGCREAARWEEGRDRAASTPPKRAARSPG